MRESQKAKFDHMVEKGLEEWVSMQEFSMSETEYLRLLLNYRDHLEGRL